MATVVRELLIRISTMGEQVVSGAFRKVTGDINTNVEALEGARTAYLYLAFGLLATGGMLKRWGSQLSKISGNMIQSFRDLEQQAAITSSILGGMGEHHEDLAKKMKELGILTEFTATQAGEAMQKLAMAGFNVNEVLGAAEGTLRLATIGLMDVSEAADIAAGVYRGFGYEAEEATEVTEQMNGIVSQLAFALTHSAMTANDLGDALKFVAASASAVGWTLEDATVGLMVAADNMVRAGIAGRALRMSLIKLSKEVGATTAGFTSAGEVIQMYGLDFVDAGGQLKGFIDIVEELQEQLGDLTEMERQAALAALFGTRAVTFWSAAMDEPIEKLRDRELGLKAAAAKEAIFNKLGYEGTEILKQWREEIVAGESAMHFLQNEMGFTKQAAEDINEVITYNEKTFTSWEEVVSDASTTMAVVDERLGTLTGSIILFESSLDALYATFGESLAPMMQKWYDLLKIIADLLSELPEWVKAPIGLIILLGGVFMQLAGSILTTLGSMAMLMAAMVMLEKESVKTMTTQELLAFAIKKVGMAALGTAKKLVILAVRGFGTLLFYIGPLVGAVLLIQHVWVKFGDAAGILTTALMAVALWLWYTRVRVWLLARGWLGLSAATSKATAETMIYNSVIRTTNRSVNRMTVAERFRALSLKQSALWTGITKTATWLYSGATTIATVVAKGFGVALGFVAKMAMVASAALGPLFWLIIGIAALFGIFVGSLIMAGKETDKAMGGSYIPEAFEYGAARIQGTIVGLDEDLQGSAVFGMKPQVPELGGPVVPGRRRGGVIIAPTAQVTFEGGVTLGGDEATLRKMQRMVQEGTEDAVKRSLRAAEKEIEAGVVW